MFDSPKLTGFEQDALSTDTKVEILNLHTEYSELIREACYQNYSTLGVSDAPFR